MTEAVQPEQVNFALYPQAHTSIDALVGRVDVFPTEQHTFTQQKTEYPVESGSTLIDQAVLRPATLRLSALTSDILPAPGNRVSPDRAADTWNTIERLMRDHVVVVVVTPLRVYRDMLITRAAATRDQSTGRALSFQLDLAEVLFTDTELVPFSPDQVSTEGPAAERTSAVDRGDVTAPVVVLPVDQQAAGRRIMVEAGDILVPNNVPDADLEALIEDPTTASNNPAAEALRPSFPDQPSEFRNVVRAQRIPLTADPRQTFRTILGGQSVRLTVYWQPTSQAWYISIGRLDNTPIVSSVRLTQGGAPLRGLVLDGFVGELVVSGSGATGLHQWEEGYELVYVVSESLL